jgi:hypothetical protein
MNEIALMLHLVMVPVLLTQLAASAAAPADRYFGRLEMSALRIRYETMQLKKRYETHQLLPDQTMHLLLLTEEAFRNWARSYPKDSWLPSTGYAMAELYEELPGPTARDHAVSLLVYVNSHFPNTPYAKRGRDQLHRGISTKPQPSWAAQPRQVSPSPASSAPPPSGAAAPATTASPTATP